jgi:5-methylcytosine-specific restriction enzyme A
MNNNLFDSASLRQKFSERISSAMEESIRLKIVTLSIQGMLRESHAVETAKRLVGPGREDKEVKSGLRKLAKARRLDLSFESIMLERQFTPLFTKNDLTWARWNLFEVDKKYSPPEGSEQFSEGVSEQESVTAALGLAEDVLQKKEGTEWSNEELAAAVSAYFDMQMRERNGEKIEKVQYYRTLSQQYGRSVKSFELRMQNISYVLLAMGRTWLKGLAPAKNVGTNVAIQIETLIAEAEGRQYPPSVEFYIRTQEALAKEIITAPLGIKTPLRTNVSITQTLRDPKVKAWILQKANGNCNCCGRSAPFNDRNGQPFLEVHHVRPLAEGGSDTPRNVVAVCPNCHRELHQGINNFELIETLYERNEHLVRE